MSAVPEASTKFRNAILCEDIREELGGKHSLMGIVSGDIIVPVIPATIQVAFFTQYFLSEDESHQLKIVFRLMQDDGLMAQATLEANVQAHHSVATMLLPKAHATFEKETTFKILASVNDGPEELILSKKLMKQN